MRVIHATAICVCAVFSVEARRAAWRKIERDGRSPPRGRFSTSELQMHKLPTTFAYPGSCRWLQLPLRSPSLGGGGARARAYLWQESLRRHVAMEINAPSSDFLVGSNVRWSAARVVTGISLRYADGTLTRLPRRAYSTPSQQCRNVFSFIAALVARSIVIPRPI